MPELISQTIGGTYTLLRRPSQAKLHYEVVRERSADLLRGYVQDEQLSTQDHRTQVASVTMVPSDVDYILQMQDVPDYEETKLEYNPGTGGSTAWYDVKLVPFGAWEQHFDSPYIAAAFYGSDQLPDGRKVKLNLTQASVAAAQWQLSYRIPLLAALQMGDTPPLPSNFMAMVRYDLAVDCMPLVRDSSPEWKEWMKETKPDYIARVADWRIRWREYLERSVGQTIQQIKPFNHFRGRTRAGTRGYVPAQ